MTAPPRIFVAIASYLEPLLVATVTNAIAQADRPEQLSFGIAEQAINSCRAELLALSNRIALVHVDPSESDGPAWARGLAMDLRDGEDFCCQIDAHMHFAAGWDTRLVATWRAVAERSAHTRILLSTFPTAWRLDPESHSSRLLYESGKAVTSNPLGNIPVANESVLCTLALPGARLQQGHLVCNSFLFAPGDFADALPTDRNYFFGTDDVAISARAYTHGWDVWHPEALLIRHLYRRVTTGEAILRWEMTSSVPRPVDVVDRVAHSQQRLSRLLVGELHGAYGVGSVRLIEDFLANVGTTTLA